MDKLNKIVINQDLATLIAAVTQDYVKLLNTKQSIQDLRVLYPDYSYRSARENCDEAIEYLNLVMKDVCQYVGEEVVRAQIEEFGLKPDDTEDEEED